MSDILARRVAQRERLVAKAREHVERLSKRRKVTAAVVVGSVARGDFNVWSDVDVIVLIDTLPDRAPDRVALANDGAPTGVQVVAYTSVEFADAIRRRNRMAIEAIEDGILLYGELPAAS